MRPCRLCGHENADHLPYCSQCGRRMEGGVALAAARRARADEIPETSPTRPPGGRLRTLAAAAGATAPADGRIGAAHAPTVAVPTVATGPRTAMTATGGGKSRPANGSATATATAAATATATEATAVASVVALPARRGPVA